MTKRAAKVVTVVKLAAVGGRAAKKGAKAYGAVKGAKVVGRPVVKVAAIPVTVAGGVVVWRKLKSNGASDTSAPAEAGRPLGPVANANTSRPRPTPPSRPRAATPSSTGFRRRSTLDCRRGDVPRRAAPVGPRVRPLAPAGGAVAAGPSTPPSWTGWSGDGFLVLGGPLADDGRVAHAVEADVRASARRSRATRGARRTCASTRSSPGRSGSTRARP